MFDGYRKHMTHQRRTGGKIGVEVTFTEDMKLATKKGIFLSILQTNIMYILLRRQYVGRGLYLQVQPSTVDGHLLSESGGGGVDGLEKDGNLVQIMTYPTSDTIRPAMHYQV